MVNLMTKVFILTIASNFSLSFILAFMMLHISMATLSVAMATLFMATLSIGFMATLSVAMDLFINLLSVVLGFKKYESYYMKICQKCHVKCINMCSKMVSGTDKTTI
eukprot:214629_1